MTPGPELGALLAGVDLAAVADEQLVGVLQASWRQLSHDHVLYLAAMVEIGRRERAIERRDAERGTAPSANDEVPPPPPIFDPRCRRGRRSPPEQPAGPDSPAGADSVSVRDDDQHAADDEEPPF